MEFKLPSGWDEIIAADAYQAVIRTLMTAFPDKEAAYVAMFKVLTETNLEDALPLGDFIGQLGVAFALKEEIFPALDFIFNRTPFYKNPIPFFVHKEIKYIGPEERLVNQTGAEWVISHHAMFLFNKKHLLQHLKVLLAANYHAEVNGERRTFDEKQFEKDIEIFNDVPEWVLQGFCLWYNHADEFWMKKYPQLFSSDGDKKATSNATGEEIRNILFELAGNSLGDAWDKVNLRNRQDLIFALSRLEERRMALEEATKK